MHPPEIPTVPGLPLVGNLHQLIPPDRIIPQLERWSRTVGRTFAVHTLGRRMVCFSELEPVLYALKHRPEAFRRLHNLEVIARELGAHGLLTAEGEDWRKQREFMKAAFSRRAVSRTFGSIPLVTERLLGFLSRQDNMPVDFRSLAMRFTADVTSLLVFGEDLNTVEHDNPLQHQIELIFEGLGRRTHAPFHYWHYLKTKSERATDKAAAFVRELVLDVIRRRSKPHDGPPTLLDEMIEARATAQFSDEDLCGNVFTLLLAGEDTTANSIAWMALFLARRPDLQRALREEANGVLGDRDSAQTLDDLGGLSKTNAVFKETLRLRGAAPVVFLQTNAPTTLGGYALPKDQVTIMLLRQLSLDAEHFTEPDAFLPDRWDPAFVAAHPGWRHNLQAYLPFGAGPRTCIGAQLATIEAQTLMSALCKRFEISLVTNPHTIREMGGFVTYPSPFALRFTPYINPGARKTEGEGLSPTTSG